MYNKEDLKKEIAKIRGFLSENNLHEALNTMISLNIFDEEIDEYTRYFSNTYAEDIELDLAYNFEIDKVNGTIVVECVTGGYIPAKVSDFEDTLEEIEKKFL